MVKVKEDMTGWVMKEHGVPDSKLTVIEQADDYIRPDGRHEAQWLCKCSCNNQNTIVTLGTSIKNGSTKSCGCLQREAVTQSGYSNKKYKIVMGE